jgi:hypothetical protein
MLVNSCRRSLVIVIKPIITIEVVMLFSVVHKDTLTEDAHFKKMCHLTKL